MKTEHVIGLTALAIVAFAIVAFAIITIIESNESDAPTRAVVEESAASEIEVIEIPRRIVKVVTEIIEITPPDYEVLLRCKAFVEAWWDGTMTGEDLARSGCLDLLP